GGPKALDDVSLNLEEGVCFGLVGPNGAGKSTLIKIIARIIQNDEGSIKFANKFSNSRKQHLGYVPQDICLEENVSTLRNLYFFGKLYGLKGKALQKRANKVLDLIDLSDRKKDIVKTFSGGMKRRLNIGCALMNDPKMIMMDEPTVGIDPQARKQIFHMIEQMKKEKRTIIYSSHYIEEVEKICDEAAFIDNGRIIERGKIDDILRSHAVPALFFTCPNYEILVKEIESFGRVAKHEKGYIVKTRNPMQTAEKILQLCRKNSIVLDRFEFVQPRLEDVFFSLTEEELHA